MQVYNSLTKQKETFRPIIENQIKLYACGITVYDYCHIGHARTTIVFDVIVRYWRWRGFDVKFIRNITDIDDKIIKRANENQEPWDQLTERFIEAMHQDERALMVLSPDEEPRATRYIPQIIALIEKLIARGYAYVAANGDVYYRVREFSSYGKLSHRDIEQLEAGARVELGTDKEDPLDFVLWKMSKAGEPQWDSPWGPGRPGWHIECSAMSTDLLGQPFDFHGGGMDLKFPHHENEIAQSEAACDKNFANYWIHVGLLQVDGEKMSKSLGNFFTIREVLEKHDAELIRYFMISGHYRSPVNYSEQNLTQLRSGLDRFYGALRGLPESKAAENTSYEKAFIDAMDDDFNTPVALSVLFEIAHEIQRLREQSQLEQAAAFAALMKKLGALFCLLQNDPETYFQGNIDSTELVKIEALIASREVARQQKNWAEADKIRQELTDMGVVLEDTSKGATWRKQ